MKIPFFPKKINKKTRNQQAVEALLKLGFPLKNIRYSLPSLTGINHTEAAKKIGKARPSISNTMYGYLESPTIRRALAEIYQVPREVLFDDQVEKDQPH